MRIYDTAHNVWVTMSDEDAKHVLASNSTYKADDKGDAPKPASKRTAAKSDDSKGA